MPADPAILALIPHRPPMLLIEQLEAVSASSARASLTIAGNSPFFSSGHGVPSWIGVEYMGQTAALIAGYQQQQGNLEPHLGLLLGTRKYQAFQPWFTEGSRLLVTCNEIAVVGASLATFHCQISDQHNDEICAEAKLSVFRKPHSSVG